PQNLPIQVTIIAGAGGGSNDGVGAIAAGQKPAITATVAINDIFLEPGLIEPLVAAELAEIFMSAQNKDWNPGWSDGEALSRVSGQIFYPENAWLFATCSSWYNEGTYAAPADWVDNVEHTERSLAATCA
ncbi:hypothetical protein, partial [Bradyrhizobium sp.]|uniref:hypothetical protein n=1 Tax=Bradyrhizobium sp. TaxID=376 RepID=UPI003C27FF3A